MDLRPFLSGSVLLAAALVAPEVVASTQTVSTFSGTISGQVTDTTGAALPGVTVTLTSEALMGTQTSVTNVEGAYRFPALSPGDYTLVFAIANFQTVSREGVQVVLGFSATVNAQLDLASVNERVVVQRDSPVIDRQSTTIATNFDARQLGNLPGVRSIGGVLAATPAVQMTRFDVGGNTEMTGPSAAYGIFGQNRPMVEGINVSGIQSTGFALDFGSFDEVSVGTAAHSAEWPMAGVQIQFITKAGGNRYRGTFYGDYENRHWQSVNIDDDQIGRGAQGGNGVSPRDANRMWSYRDVNADVGGFIKKDDVWWYSSFRDQDVSTRFVNFPVEPYRTHVTSVTGKTTYRLTDHHKLIAFGQIGRNHQPSRLTPFGPAGGGLSPTTALHLSETATAEQIAWGWIWKGEWNSAINNRLYLEVRTGEFGADRPETPYGTAPRYEDIGSLIVSGGSRDWEESLRREQVLGSLSLFQDGWFGNHLLKIGGEIFRTLSTETWRTSYPQQVLHVLSNSQPVDVYLFEAPSQSVSGTWTQTAYANDSWRPHSRLTLNLGLRFDRYRVFLPEQTHAGGRFNPPQTFLAIDNVIDWNVVAPRVGATFDLTGDARTVAKFNFGHYWLPPAAQLGFNANPNSNQWWRQYRWSDLNGNGSWEEGEEGRLPVNTRGGLALESLDPNLRPPFVREVAAWLEHELIAKTSLRTGVVWRTQQQNYSRQNINQPFAGFTVPVTIDDPGPDGERGTSDDGVGVRGSDLSPEWIGLSPQNVVRNVALGSADYLTWELTTTRRFTRRWSLVAGLAHTWHARSSCRATWANRYATTSIR